jgi:ATP-dependent Lon protease
MMNAQGDGNVIENNTTQQNQPVSALEHGTFLPLLPLKSVVLLPKSIRPIIVGRQQSIQAVEHALKHDRSLFVTAQKSADTENPQVSDVFTHGTRSTILQVMRMPDNTLKVIVEGICRAKIIQSEISEGFINVHCQDLLTTSMDKTMEIEASWRHLKSLYVAYTKLNEKAPADLVGLVKNIIDIDYITDTIAVHLELSFEERQNVLEVNDLEERIMKVCTLLKKEMEILNMEQRIKGRVQNQVEKNQREYYLTEQMKAIQKELGRDENQAELAQIRSKVKGLGLSTEAHEKIEKELKRLEQMPPLSSEAVVSRHYIEWITSLPWGHMSKDRISLEQAEKILDKNHAGLAKAKERIVEFVAAKKFLSTNERSPIICLVGPPGVGKTSLGRSIADSLGREFVRISLGGIRDEAEIRGHRRTYIGALPGKIIQAMRKAKTQNPVILLDEIDKMTNDSHGDPASALLEVLDPEQNKAFVDHFLDIEYDLSKVMFIATANLIDGIPLPLFDRMEVIQLAGYTEDEKLDIVKKFLIPKNLKEHGLTKVQFKIPDEFLKKIINEYTKEAGVRQLERFVTKLMRKGIQLFLKDASVKAVEVTESLLKEWLGNPKFKKTSLDENSTKIGLATGLAWTEVGGDVLEIETTIIQGKGTVTLTGQLGDVMQESAHAALSYIRSKSQEFGLAASFHTNKDIHIHIPEGATPKDGPSAGITMCAALLSALTKISVKPSLAMTGEITLRGRVLAVGGLKEKLLAARRHGIKTVIVPKENSDDIEEVIKEVSLDLNIIHAETMEDVIKVALEKNPFEHAKEVKKNKAKKREKKTRN